MDLMSLIVWLVVGGLVGWLASMIMGPMPSKASC